MSGNTMIPLATREQVQELDALLVEQFDMPIKDLMDTAGLRLAELIQQEFPRAHNIILFCGLGHNGGDGFSAARYLQEFGYEPVIVRLEGELHETPSHFLAVADRLGIPIYFLEDYEEHVMLNKFDVVVDCVLGHGLSGAVRGAAKVAVIEINRAHEFNIPVVCCDVPSGMDCNEGPIYEPHVQPTITLSMALPRKGLVGRGVVFVADIGVPQEAYEEIGLPADDYFKGQKLLKT